MRPIDADALLEDVRKNSESYFADDFAKYWVDKQPTIEPERKKGKWIYHKDWDDDGECGYECSECGMGSEVNYNYCMRCGAKMEEEQDK